jgi:hypothetical protein
MAISPERRSRYQTQSARGYAYFTSGTFNTIYATNKYFKIDHPTAPDKQFLTHSSVERPDLKNISDGLSVLGPDGTVGHDAELS